MSVSKSTKFRSREEPLVLLEARRRRCVRERLAGEAGAPRSAAAAMPCHWLKRPDAAEHGALLLLVDDAEPALEPDARAELAQQLGAEGVDRPRLHPRRARPSVRASRSAISPAALLVKVKAQMRAGSSAELLDQEADPLDEAERLPGARARRARAAARAGASIASRWDGEGMRPGAGATSGSSRAIAGERVVVAGIAVKCSGRATCDRGADAEATAFSRASLTMERG